MAWQLQPRDAWLSSPNDQVLKKRISTGAASDHAQIGEGMFLSCENPQCTIVFSNLLNAPAFAEIAEDNAL